MRVQKHLRGESSAAKQAPANSGHLSSYEHNERMKYGYLYIRVYVNSNVNLNLYEYENKEYASTVYCTSL